MAVSRRREPEATTLTLTIPACSVSRKPGAVQIKLLRESGKLVEVALGVFSNGLADYKVPAEQKA